MPLTLPTHPMAVLPLKMWRPRWHGPAPDVNRRPLRFWGTVAAVAAAGLATLPFQPYPVVIPTQAVRCLLIGCVALVAGAVAVTPARRPVSSAPGRVPPPR